MHVVFPEFLREVAEDEKADQFIDFCFVVTSHRDIKHTVLWLPFLTHGIFYRWKGATSLYMMVTCSSSIVVPITKEMALSSRSSEMYMLARYALDFLYHSITAWEFLHCFTLIHVRRLMVVLILSIGVLCWSFRIRSSVNTKTLDDACVFSRSLDRVAWKWSLTHQNLISSIILMRSSSKGLNWSFHCCLFCSGEKCALSISFFWSHSLLFRWFFSNCKHLAMVL